jgi:preprotein translocase subunit SecF
MLKIIENTKIWFTFSLIVIITGFIFIGVRGLEYGIDFKGGTMVQLEMKHSFVKSDVDSIVKKYAPDYTSNISNNTEYDMKSSIITAEQIPTMISDIKAKYKDSTLISQDNIGASIGKETSQKAILAVIIASLCMLVYVGIRFEFRFGVAAILALIHDVLVVLSVYAIFHLPISSYFVAAVLTVIGYSMCDTIVVFDRIRENQTIIRKAGLPELVDASITQCITRSVNTVLTVLITLISVYVFVPAIREFALPLLIGIVSGCYSSIFIASPFWVILKNRSLRNQVAK